MLGKSPFLKMVIDFQELANGEYRTGEYRPSSYLGQVKTPNPAPRTALFQETLLVSVKITLPLFSNPLPEKT